MLLSYIKKHLKKLSRKINTMKKWTFLFLCLSFMFVNSAIADFGRPNLALDGNIISSTPAVSGSALGINDGLLSNVLYSYSYDGKYYCEFVLDLTKSYSIDQIDIYILQTRGFSIYVSDNNENWTLVKEKEWAAYVGTALSIPFETPVTGRYIKYYGWASWFQYVGVAEMAVYETGSLPASSPAGSLGANNIAMDKQVVSGTETDNPPANAIDGNLATSWIPTGLVVDDETKKKSYSGGIVIDLGKEINIGRVIIKANAYHSNIISFPVEPSDFWGEKWLFNSNPDLFATNTLDSGDIVFDIKGLVKSRYLTLHTQTIEVTSDNLKPDIAEIEVYEWINCPDSDGDGVPDDSDECPDTLPDSSVYSNGCPSIKGDFNNNKELDLGDCIGILKSLSGMQDDIKK
jgi:hypothetical protein